MTRDELQSLYESAIVDLMKHTPCLNCGGDSEWAQLQIRQTAFFLTEMSDKWRNKQARQTSIENAAKMARKKMERHFNAIIQKQLEEALLAEKTDEPVVEPAGEALAGAAETGEGSGASVSDPPVDPNLVGDEIGSVESGLPATAEEPAPVVDDLVGEPGALEDGGSEPPEDRIETTS